MRKVEINVLKTQDWALYKSLRLSSLVESPNSFGSTYELETEYTDEKWQSILGLSSDVTTLSLPVVAKVDGNPIGLALGYVHDVSCKSGDIYQMWIKPEGRGNGIGRKLLQAIIAWAQKLQLNTLMLSVTNTNLAAISLYLSAGFILTGNTEQLREGSTLQRQPMKLDLTS
jgi:ribosomal protein S18 acetylase RimI-like enzyme